MDRRTEIRDFLTSRRARIMPEQAGLKVSSLAGARRVAGLRREEVALLAGVSVPYYTRLERGDARGATDAVLDAISRALLLDDAERAHLFDLVRAANATAAAAQAPRRPARQPVRPELRNMLEAMSGVPAYIRNGRLDILAGNALAQALFAPIFTSPARPVNAARFTDQERGRGRDGEQPRRRRPASVPHGDPPQRHRYMERFKMRVTCDA
jgi:transcriptional regulator with XRE-family HTH domain